MERWKCLYRMALIAVGAFCAHSTTAFAAYVQYRGDCAATAAPSASSSCIDRRGTRPDAYDFSDSIAEFYSAPNVGTQNAAAGYSESADFGRLGINAFATLSGATRFNVSGGASVSTSVSFVDEITVLSSSLPIGALINIEYSIPVHGYFSRNGSGSGLVNLDWVIGGARSTLPCQIDERNVDLRGNCSAVGMTSVRVGETFQVIEDLILELRESGSGTVAYSYAISGNFGSTAEMFFSATDPSVLLNAASGHNYAFSSANAVAEPPTFVLLSVGALGVCITRRSRRTFRA